MSTTTEVPDLKKVYINPSKSVIFIPVAKKQMVVVEVYNHSTTVVLVEFKNKNPEVYETCPWRSILLAGEKKEFRCMYKGQPEEKCKMNDRFTIHLAAGSENKDTVRAWYDAQISTHSKRKLTILFQGINDQKQNETETPTPDTQKPMNKDEDVDKEKDQQAVKDEHSKVEQK